ncbi:hypothetical protein H6P81_016099 [Aristolochia fimbriata]|uniref:Retrotransposon gag domain-containing protein n=1 Tax=Aristolochia fimbriata TaxID=158543 RepID=A0AAV7E939_ARIFI|nr:hypothetical protein H6P81_016099 [Aristolochia fimbriata]
MTCSRVDTPQEIDPEPERALRQRLKENQNQSTPKEQEDMENLEGTHEEQRPRRTMEDYVTQSPNTNRTSIITPTVHANNLDFKPQLLVMLQTHYQFSGLANEDPNDHLERFLDLCATFKYNGVSDDAARLRLFKFTLAGRAKTWLNTLPAGSITTWEDLQETFLESSFARFLETFKTLKINFPLLEAVKQMPLYRKFLKEILSGKRKMEEQCTIVLNENCSAILKNELPTKLKDPGSFTIPCEIGSNKFVNALCDLGASVNLMSLSLCRYLKLREPQEIGITLQFADRSTKIPGVKEDVLVKIQDFIYPCDFIVLDMEVDKNLPIIHGRPFLATAGSIIDCKHENLTLTLNNDTISFNIKEAMKQPAIPHDDFCLSFDVIDYYIAEIEEEEMIGEEGGLVNSEEKEYEDPIMTREVDELEAESKEEGIKEQGDQGASKPELKPLPNNLKYVFLEENAKPVIISSCLTGFEEKMLIEVLSKHKKAIGWSLADIEGINPTICTHRILMEDNYKTSIQPLRSLNTSLQEVVKKEVIKLLDSGIIYPISDSAWLCTGYKVTLGLRDVYERPRGALPSNSKINPEEQDLQDLEDEEEPIEEVDQSIPFRSEEIVENPQPKETFESKESVCPYDLEDEEEPIEEIVAEVEEKFIPLLIFQLIEKELQALVAEEESMAEEDEFKEERPMAEIAMNVEEVEEKTQQAEISLEAEKETIVEELDEGEEEETISHIIELSHEKPLENWHCKGRKVTMNGFESNFPFNPGGMKLLVWLRTINLALHGRQPMAENRRRKLGLSYSTIHSSFLQKKRHQNTQVNSVQKSSAAATLFEQPSLEQNSEISGSGTHQGKSLGALNGQEEKSKTKKETAAIKGKYKSEIEEAIYGDSDFQLDPNLDHIFLRGLRIMTRKIRPIQVGVVEFYIFNLVDRVLKLAAEPVQLLKEISQVSQLRMT